MRRAPLCILVCMLAAAAALEGCKYLPRMAQQQSIRPYEQPMPASPARSVPRRAAERAPAGMTAADRDLYGRLYYNRYCAMCHGPDGRGHVPVGESYHPAPTDLSAPALQARSDEDLARAMTSGVGHEPTLPYIVPEERRPLIMRHLRTLADGAE